MNTTRTSLLPEFVRKHPVWCGVGALALVALMALLLAPRRSTMPETAYHEVGRGDFIVSVVEPGSLAAVSEVVIRNEVEGTARIVSIVPEGSYVRKGDLLVELDAAQAQDQLNTQLISYEKAKFAVEQARAQLEITRSATNSDFMTAELKLRFAKIDREKYLQGQQMVDLVEASNRVVQAQAQLAVGLDTYRNSTNLAARGYETKQKVDGDRLAVLNLANSLIVATNTLWMLQKFDVQKQLEKFDTDVRQAEQELDRVVNQNKRKMAQYEADLQAQLNTLNLSEERLERDKKNLESSKIYAPQEGLVVYQVSENRWSSESLVEGGAVVRNRQELIKLPDLSRMKVTVKVHESHVTMIRPGLPAYIILDSLPDQRFQGVVERVAPLPDSQSRWGNPNLKVYNTEIFLTDTIPNVKPGVSAKAEILVTNIANALSVPIQAVTTLKGRQVCYVQRGSEALPQPVELGLFNTKFIEVTKGLNEGDRVLLAPPFDTKEKDLGGSVLAAGEKPPAPPTNLPAARPGPGGPGENGAGGPITGAEGAGRRRGPNLEEMRKQFDKDGNGQLDETERAAMQSAMAASGGRGTNRAGGRMNQEEFLKRFDKNGDGQIDETERAAIMQSFGGSRGGPSGGAAGAEGRGPRRDGEGTPGPGGPGGSGNSGASPR